MITTALQRLGPQWLLAALLAVVYVCLPENDEPAPMHAHPSEDGVDPHRLHIVDVVPNDPAAGSVIVIKTQGGSNVAPTQAWLGHTELAVLARRPDTLVARLPNELGRGMAKLRLSSAADRSKAFELQIKAPNWRKPFRNLCGGLALLVLGVQGLGRAARGVLGIAHARRVTGLLGSRIAAVGFGFGLGVSMQSTTAAAGLLAGAAGSRVLSIAVAAALFVGAQLGAAVAPLLFFSVSEPRWGLVAIAAGALALGLSSDRRGKALAGLVLGAGMVAYGVQVLRPGFEPFASSPTLLGLLDRLAPEGVLGTLATMGVGALLVAVFQGPAPVLALALGVAETTGHQNLRTTLVMMSGAGLGAGLGALLTMPSGAHARRLAELNLVAGACNSVFALATIDVFDRLAEQLLGAEPPGIRWGKHLLPQGSWQIALAFALAQLTAAALLVPLLPHLARRLARWHTPEREPAPASAPLATAAVSGRLVLALAAQERALPALSSLALHGGRSHGRTAELEFQAADAELSALLAGPVLALPPTAAGLRLGRSVLAAVQLQRALEQLLRTAELWIETRIAARTGAAEEVQLSALAERDAAQLTHMHALIADGLGSVRRVIAGEAEADPEDVRAREIELNSIEARLRSSLLLALLRQRGEASDLGLIELSDAYENAGNQLYRLAEQLSGEGDDPELEPDDSLESITNAERAH